MAAYYLRLFTCELCSHRPKHAGIVYVRPRWGTHARRKALPSLIFCRRHLRSARSVSCCYRNKARWDISDAWCIGGIFGVLLAFGVLYPRRTVMLLFPPVPMPAWLLVTVFGLIELANGVLGTEAGVAHFAHLGGMLGAYLELRYWRQRR